jgi:hypothetical protein
VVFVQETVAKSVVEVSMPDFRVYFNYLQESGRTGQECLMRRIKGRGSAAVDVVEPAKVNLR